jgi:hypothetical protein
MKKIIRPLSLLMAFCGYARANVLHNYVYFGADRENISNPAFLRVRAFEGAQIGYSWKELEPTKDAYDFSAIQHDQEFLKSNGKKLFVQVYDVTFEDSRINVPRYLLEDRAYHGGADRQYTESGAPGGWVARRWDPVVRERFQKLLYALGKSFDGKIEGINLSETAVDISESGPKAPEGFTYAGYRDGILADMKALKQAFPRSVTIQYANFMPGEWLPDDNHSFLQSVYQYAEQIGVGVGGPDLMPYKPGQMNHAYRFIHEVKGTVPVGIAVQDGNYDYVDPKTSRRISIQGIFDFANDYLNADYIFWCTEEPSFSRDVVPYFDRRESGALKSK